MSEAIVSSIYWDANTKQRAQELATRERRSVSSLVCWLVDQEYRRRQVPANQLVDAPPVEYVTEKERA